MKKFLAILLALVMVLALAACGGDGEGEGTNPASGSGTSTPSSGTSTPTSEPEETEPPKPADAEPLPAEALNHWDFESADGLTPVHQIPKPADSELSGITYDIAESKHELQFADGAVGKALYLDGKYGVSLDMKAPTDDSYTIAFWYNGDRFITLGPIVQMGRNIGMSDNADPASAVTWYNICQSTWGADGAALTPTIWNRNSSIGTEIAAAGVWPWVGPDTVYGKKEWAHVAVVVDGVRYTADDGMERIGCKLYVNGVLMFDANSENLFYQGVAPEIFQHLDTAVRGLEAYIGINYWDACYKGFIDDLYVYDEALTPGQVTTLYQLGDPSVASTAPEYTGPTDDDEGSAPEPATPIDPATLTAAPVDANALDVMGTPDRVCAWLSDNTGSYEVPVGKTVTFKFNNYSNGVANWNNLSLAFCDKEFATDVLSGDVAGMTEYVSIRADAWDWGSPGGDNAAVETISWTDWAAWLQLMTDAEVTVECSRDGANCIANFTFTGADGTVMTLTQSVATTLTDDLPLYVYFRADSAYVELLSVETK